jgi:hypothetical protein
MQLSLKKGSVDHNCEPACALHELEAQQAHGGTTGKQSMGGWLGSVGLPALLHPALLLGCTLLNQCAAPLSAGQIKGSTGREADAPHFVGTAGQGARGFGTLARRGMFTSATSHQGKGAMWAL